MDGGRGILGLAGALALAFPLAANAEFRVTDASPLALGPANPPRTTLGLTVAGAHAVPCTGIALLCDNRPATRLSATTPLSRSWAWEVGYVDTGRLPRVAREDRAQGLNLSLVGHSSLAPGFGVYGKLGTTFARAETSAMGAGPVQGAEQGFGLTWAAGMRYAFTPRVSATFELDNSDYRFAGGRDPVRSANLGLQLRY